MQFKIPQDVQRADKIVGPLTFKQLIIATIGGGICYSLYAILSKTYFIEIWLPPVIFVALLTAAIAFLKIHDIPFLRWLFFFSEFKLKPRSRTWQKMAGDTFISSFTRKKEKTLPRPVQDKETLDNERRKKLDELTKLVDTHGKTLTKGK